MELTDEEVCDLREAVLYLAAAERAIVRSGASTDETRERLYRLDGLAGRLFNEKFERGAT